MTAEPKTFGQKVRELRETADMTQEQLAQAASVSVSAVYQIEAGKMANPRLDTLRGLAKALGVSLDELAGGGT